MKMLLQIAILPFVFLACAAGGFYWIFWTLPFGKNATDKARLKDVFGLFGPDMAPHWGRLFRAWPPYEIYESLKNIGSEWTRLDANRAIKLTMAAMLLLVVCLGVI